MIRKILIGWVMALSCVAAIAQDPPPTVPTDPSGALSSDITSKMGIDDRRRNMVPLSLEFTDETGKTVMLRDLVKDKPVIFVPIFYTCKSSCTVITNSVIEAVRKINRLKLDRDYRVISISIHPHDTYKDAAAKKQELEEAVGKVMHVGGVHNGWRLLTGTPANVKQVTDAVGFRFYYDEKRDVMSHPAGIMILTRDGMVSRYFYGVEYVPALVLEALDDAEKNRIGPEAEKRLFGCLEYDATRGRYKLVVFRALQVGCVLTFLVLATSITVMSLRHRQPRPLAKSSDPKPKS